MTGRAVPGASRALLVLSLINLLNYLDRYLVAGVLPRIEEEFGISHGEAGLLGTLFVVVYMVAAPLAGYVGDRVQRRYVVAASVVLWSAATVGSGLAVSFAALLVSRALIGVGEAGYGTVAPTILSDLFPRAQRTRVLSYFYVAIPVGAALGYAVGGWIGETWSWRAAFFVGGAPGLVLGVAMLFSPEPRRGATEEDPALARPEKVPLGSGLREIATNATFWFNTVGLTLLTFSIGGLSYWMPSFLELERGLSASRAGFQFGAVTALGGLAGTLLGGVLGDRAERRVAGGGMWVSAIGMLLGAPAMWLAANLQSEAAIFGTILVAQILLFLNNGPINAAVVSCARPALRALTFGVNTLLIHALGDAISPPVIGRIAERTSLGRAIELNAIPVLVGAVVLGVGALWLRRAAAGAPPPVGPAP